MPVINPSASGGGGQVHLWVPFITQWTKWTDMPSALSQDIDGTQRRAWLDLTTYTQARIVVNRNAAGATNAELRGQYWNNSAWTYLDGVDGPKINIAATGHTKSAWVNLAAEAKADWEIRVVGINGDAVADPIFNSLALAFK